MNRLVLFFLLFIIAQQLAAQSKKGNIGVFGEGLALDFNFSPPIVYDIPGMSYDTDEGSASICDNDGKLLFYTNGTEVWNRNFEYMPHNLGLRGSDRLVSTTQIIIVPIPKDPFQYYIISPGTQTQDMTYSLIDMRLNRGLGDVVFENRLLCQNCTEKVTIVKHTSKESLWLITHEYGTNTFRTFLIDEEGLHTDYIPSSAGLVHAVNFENIPGLSSSLYGTNAIGYLKPSHAGNLLACAIDGEMGTLELFKFDKSTGIVSDPIELLNQPEIGCYGVEFSGDDSKLYVSGIGNTTLYQFDVSSGNATTIINSKNVISTSVMGALQLGPDNKIYVVPKTTSYFLDRINSPNNSGAACDFEKDAVNLGTRSVWVGLPEFIYNTVDPEIIYNGYCAGMPTKFNLIRIKEFTSIEWNFGDAASGVNNVSTDISPSHTYASAGVYHITTKIKFADNSIFDYSQKISLFSTPKVTLGKDSAHCAYYNKLILDPETDPIPLEYTWNDGSTDYFFEATGSGQYWVEVNDGVCVASDTIDVVFVEFPEVHLMDTILCIGQSVPISLPTALEYTWNDGSTSHERILTAPGKFIVEGKNKCGVRNAQMNLTFMPKLSISFPADTVLCYGQKLKLSASNLQTEYLWQDGTTAPNFVVSTSGQYWAQAFHRCESVSDTIKVDYLSERVYTIPNVITPNGDGLNDYFKVEDLRPNSNLTILDRWGLSVYSSPDYKNDWDGKELSSGNYYYLLKDICANKETKGWLSILR